ncbi:WD40-repeat-containing domain protein [Zopfochytrium polystomum]|nr:WD40-repeat-containing domain protein [Zopfochytrium polystomum]
MPATMGGDSIYCLLRVAPSPFFFSFFFFFFPRSTQRLKTQQEPSMSMTTTTAAADGGAHTRAEPAEPARRSMHSQHQPARMLLDEMPEEILHRMLLYLAFDYKSLARLCCASRRWFLRSEKIWRAMFLARWALPVSLSVSPNVLDRGKTMAAATAEVGVEARRICGGSSAAEVPWKTLFRDRSALASFRAPQRKSRLKDGHSSFVTAICVDAFSIVTAAGDGKVKIWDRATKKCLQTLDASERGLESVACHGSTIACGTSDGEVKLLNAKTGKLEDTLRGLDRSVYFVHIDSELVIAAAGDRVNVWRRSSKTICKTFTKQTSGSVDVHDGLITFATSDNAVQVLRLLSGEVVYSQQLESTVLWIQQENSIVVAAWKSEVAAWDIHSGARLFADSRSFPVSLHNGNLLVISKIGGKECLVIRDLANGGTIVRTIRTGRNIEIYGCSILHTSGVMVGDAFGGVEMWDFDEGIPYAHEFMELKK